MVEVASIASVELGMQKKSFQYIPLLLVVSLPLATVLVTIGSLWLLVLPGLALQLVAVFVGLEEYQGASLLLHVMTLLSVALSCFLLSPLLWLSWCHLLLYMLCIAGYIGLNLLLHIQVDYFIEEDKETAVTLEVALLKFYPPICTFVFNWVLFSSIPAPISHYVIIALTLVILICFCYPHRSSFADDAKKDILLAYEDSVVVSAQEALIATSAAFAIPVFLYFLSFSTIEHSLFHLVAQESVVCLVLSFAPVLEFIKYTDMERRYVESTLRGVGSLLAAAAVILFYTVSSETNFAVLSQLLVSIIAAFSLAYTVSLSNERMIAVCVIASTLSSILQLLSLDINHEDIMNTDVSAVYQLVLSMGSLLLFSVIASKSPINSHALIPLFTAISVWIYYNSFLVKSAILSSLPFHIINLIIAQSIFCLHTIQRISFPTYLAVSTLLLSAELSHIRFESVSLYQTLYASPSVAILLLTCVFSERVGALTENALKSAICTAVCAFVHLFSGFSVFSSVHYLLLGYEPSYVVLVGVYVVVVTVTLARIWGDKVQSVFWIGLALVIAGVGLLIIAFEPDILGFRSVLSGVLGLLSLVWVTCVVNLPAVVRSDEVLLGTAVVSGVSFGTIATFLLVSVSWRLVVVWALYCTVCSAVAFVLLTLWTLNGNPGRFPTTKLPFQLIFWGSLLALGATLVLELRLDLTLDMYATQLPLMSAPPPPCVALFFVCFSLMSTAVKVYQFRLVNKYIHHKLPTHISGTERVFTLVGLLLGLVAMPAAATGPWLILLSLLAYRPDVKPWLLKQKSSHLSLFYPLLVYTILGLLCVLRENPIFTPKPISSWDTFCYFMELLILVPTVLCHLSNLAFLYSGDLEKTGLYTGLILMAPLGVLMLVFGGSASTMMYGSVSSLGMMYVVWNDLPFSD